MNSPDHPSSDDSPVIEPAQGATYTIDVIAQLTGVSSQTILFYQERGLLDAASATPVGERTFDDDALRTIRRLEHLRTELELKEPALHLIATLLAEVERLRDEARRGR